MATHVCITIDTEFSIAGAFSYQDRLPVADPYVWCEVAGNSQGLGFLLDCFQKYHVSATFFIEALHRHYFKHDPMRSIAHRIYDRGHEVQLHIHPCWAVFQHEDWRERQRETLRRDNFFGRSEDESVALIRQGTQAFRDWGLPIPKVFRSGSLEHDDSLYRAIARVGIPYSSNIGLAIFDSGDPRYQLYAGSHDRHGVIECPVLTFNDWSFAGRRHLKSLTVTGASFAETCTLLEQAHRVGVSLVVILTHPFEYIQSRDLTLRHARPHHINQKRLTKLCQFLEQNRDRFPTSGLAEAARKSIDQGLSQNPLFKGVSSQSVCRMATQVFYDRYGHWMLSRKRDRSNAKAD